MGKIDELCIRTIMLLSADAVERAKSGHPGMPMGDAAMAYVLWTRFLRHNPRDPLWLNRDRFVLSAGHGSLLLYSLLHLTGHDISLEDIKNFRQWESKTPGHPEYCPSSGIETTTGPLGQGFATGIGMAMAERYLAGMFNRPGFPVVDYNIYGIVGDGDLMEGISSEAASLAGHLGLGKVIYLYSDNKITIEGSTDLAFTEDVQKRFQAFGWHTERVDGYDLRAVEGAIRKAKKEKDRPSLILARTHIGYGCPGKQDCASAHGAPLGAEEIALVKKAFGFPQKEFHVPAEALRHMRSAVKRGKDVQAKWQALMSRYAGRYPDLAARMEEMAGGKLPAGWQKGVPVFKPVDGPLATRSASGKVLNALAESLPQIVGGSADLAPSNNTFLKKYPAFAQGKAGRNIHFGVREHAMGAVLNGMALSGMLIPYGGTFLVFSDYMRPAERLAALMGLGVIYVFTHDSIGVGEDGPTHQPVEHLFSLRAIPNLTVIRPADANETAEAWKVAVAHRSGPVALILSRQKLPVLDRGAYPPASGLRRGAYVLSDPEGRPDLIIIASGSEVHPSLKAAEALAGKGVKARVVNMASMELFERQPARYRDEVLPPDVEARLAVEAGATLGWHKYVGLKGSVLGLDRFGASAPGGVLFEKFGFTPQNIVKRATALLRTKG
ncbi:MAG: transketolase [Thermodesulfovibrionales bacterium]